MAFANNKNQNISLMWARIIAHFYAEKEKRFETYPFLKQYVQDYQDSNLQSFYLQGSGE